MTADDLATQGISLCIVYTFLDVILDVKICTILSSMVQHAILNVSVIKVAYSYSFTVRIMLIGHVHGT